MDYLVLSLSPKLRSMITKATHPLTITITIKMLRQRQQEVKGKMSKLRAEESATQTFKSKVQISTTKVETSGDPRDPSLSQRRLSSNLVTSSGYTTLGYRGRGSKDGYAEYEPPVPVADPRGRQRSMRSFQWGFCKAVRCLPPAYTRFALLYPFPSKMHTILSGRTAMEPRKRPFFIYSKRDS
jgi:hypothetical protein